MINDYLNLQMFLPDILTFKVAWCVAAGCWTFCQKIVGSTPSLVAVLDG